MKTKQNFLATIAFLLLFFFNGPCLAVDQKDTLKILFVGNSYTYVGNLPQITSILSQNTKIKLLTRKSTFPAAKLSQHWRGEKGSKTKEMIKSGNFDIVVLQEQSMGCIEEPDSVLKYLKLFCDLIISNGAKPCIYATWTKENAPQNQEIINKVLLKSATENNAVLVNVGNAWSLAKQLKPEIKLYAIDGSHPNESGTLLTAYVFIATILNEVPEKILYEYRTTDINGESVYLMFSDPKNVTLFKQIAEQIIRQ
jgi:hypothetical protein